MSSSEYYTILITVVVVTVSVMYLRDALKLREKYDSKEPWQSFGVVNVVWNNVNAPAEVIGRCLHRLIPGEDEIKRATRLHDRELAQSVLCLAVAVVCFGMAATYPTYTSISSTAGSTATINQQKKTLKTSKSRTRKHTTTSQSHKRSPQSRGSGSVPIWPIWLVFGIVALIASVWFWVSWECTIWLITNMNVTYARMPPPWLPWLGEFYRDCPVTEINGVNSERTFSDKMLGGGRVSVTTNRGSEEDKYVNDISPIPNPEGFARDVKMVSPKWRTNLSVHGAPPKVEVVATEPIRRDEPNERTTESLPRLIPQPEPVHIAAPNADDVAKRVIEPEAQDQEMTEEMEEEVQEEIIKATFNFPLDNHWFFRHPRE